MNVAELIKSKAGKPVISFEFSRPKSEKAAASLDKALVERADGIPEAVGTSIKNAATSAASQ